MKMKRSIVSKIAAAICTAVLMGFIIVTTDVGTALASEHKKSEVIKFEAKEVNGAKESTAKAGQPLTVEVHNSLTAPHGFKIEGYVQDQTIGAGETKSFTFTPKVSGTLKVTCHLHPAHVGAEIKVQ